MRNYVVGESKCQDEEESVGDQNVNSIDLNEPTQKFEKSKKMDEIGSNNQNEDVTEGI